ncbi:MAG: methyltransferase domain-containing protein, partial [Candidatus Dormibacteraeota bacterium]|nr:methyltransferase domain-containing protein [Candidatus Dormibacteraeota bacterium]
MGVETAADPFTSLLLAFYEQAAPRYDDWAGGVHRKAAARLAQLAAVQPGELVVDAGTGTGLFVRAITSAGHRAARVLGVDISQPMLDIAEANCTDDPTVTFGRGVVEDLVLRENQVSVVALGLVLSDVADPEAVLLEARRVLRPGGRVVVSEFRRSLQTEV